MLSRKQPPRSTVPGNGCGTGSGSSKPKALKGNPLLVQYPVGKGKPSCYDLPAADHAYGKKIDRVADESAAQVLTHWNVKQKSKTAVTSLDYIVMNRSSIKEGITSPKDQYEYRKSHPVRVKLVDHSDGKPFRPARTLPSNANPNFTYGKPTRPSSPVSKLLTDFYCRKALVESKKKLELEARKILEKKKHHHPTSADTKPLQHKRQTKTQTSQKELFKMKKFQGVASKIVSHHSDEFWQKVNKAHESNISNADNKGKSVKDEKPGEETNETATAEGRSEESQ